MTVDNYTNSLIIQASPEKIYDAITTEKGLQQWWTKQVELYPHIGGTGTFTFGKNVYVVMKIAKLVPGKEIVWKCVEQFMPIKGSEKTDEWVGTTLRFSIVDNKDETAKISFIHEGITPDTISYKNSSKDWNHFFNSLKLYLETGKGTPYEDK